MDQSFLSILEQCDENSVLKICFENAKRIIINMMVSLMNKHDLTEKDFLDVLNKDTVIDSSKNELFVKLAIFIHECKIKEQVLLNCIYEPFSKDVLDKLPENAFNQAYLDKDCSEKDAFESLKQEPCFGIFKHRWDNGKFCNFIMINELITHDLKYLKYAHENGYLWNKELCANSAKIGNLDCLKYLHENGCEWNERTCINAAENGHLDCLKYATENGCPCDVVNGHLDCLKYSHKNDCK